MRSLSLRKSLFKPYKKKFITKLIGTIWYIAPELATLQFGRQLTVSRKTSMLSAAEVQIVTLFLDSIERP
jgi:serine/threonine protein kinase